MSRRALHWLVLCFATVWFGVLVPVHNRGEIALPGGGPSVAARRSCHAAPPARVAAGGRHCGDPRHCPQPERDDCPTRACAVCFFVAGLDAPPPVTTIVTRLGAAGVLDLPPPVQLPTPRSVLPFHSRAPPAA